MKFEKIYSLLFIFFLTLPVAGQKGDKTEINDNKITDLVNKFKKDIRGPYRDIRWFCNDGTINQPKEPCDNAIGGVQHARYKEEVISLGNEYNVFLGQILSNTDFNAFWDQENYHSRLKQYQLEKYLKSIDNGWIHQKAQFYRGAVQAEDEEAWGVAFFKWLLKDDAVINKHFYLLRQALKDIPHSGDDNIAQLMRSQSKIISDEFEPFMNLRIKIHGQPEKNDIQKVLQFKKNNQNKLTPGLNKKIDELTVTMERFFKPIELQSLTKYVANVTNDSLKLAAKTFIAANTSVPVEKKIEASSELMWSIRQNILNEKTSRGRLSLFDLSLKLEELILKNINQYPEDNLSSLLNKTYYLSLAAAASGYTEIWEWETLVDELSKNKKTTLTLQELNDVLTAARNQLEWGTGKTLAIYEDVVSRYESFEPLVHGFIDDKIRGSVALPLGNCIGKLGDFIANQSSIKNHVLSLTNPSHIRGLNPGYTLGELVVISGNAENLDVKANNIYVFERAPSDLKPVAGILTVSEGNLVSHVQLLARNLGIPNAAISSENLQEFKAFAGQKVFYAVSNKGNIIIKPENDMSDEEKALFSEKQRQEEMIRVPVEKIDLNTTTVLNLRDVNAASSGISCGPKAANMGELKSLFPEMVVEGLVIPFGIFLQHMKQPIPGESRSYWNYLNHIFETARNMQSSGESEEQIEQYQLTELGKLRSLIVEMPLLEDFKKDIEDSFLTILSSSLGETAVFLRSDTNMEDLKDFTGAGLNLTVFNVVDRDKIFTGIKNVWASPYTERSFKWRQKYLLNPENVYPSILVVPSVNNDKSGVLITKGVVSGNEEEVTVAFSRGVGGAVDGQAAESWVISDNGEFKLMSPAREPFYNSLPESGGLKKNIATFEEPVLSKENLWSLFEFSKKLKQKFKDNETQGPYDVELGFKDNELWLFQVRPFVENKRAKSSEYLESITPKINMNTSISVETKL